MSSPTGGEQSGTALASTDVPTQGEVSPNDARSYPSPPSPYDEDSSEDEGYESDHSGPTSEDEAKARGRPSPPMAKAEPLPGAPPNPPPNPPPTPPLIQGPVAPIAGLHPSLRALRDASIIPPQPASVRPSAANPIRADPIRADILPHAPSSPPPPNAPDVV